jgi:hypothetical protein
MKLQSVTTLLCVGLVLLTAGCASVRENTDPEFVVRKRPVEKVEPTPTEDMNPVEKTGYYLFWIAICTLYGFAGVTPASSP